MLFESLLFVLVVSSSVVLLVVRFVVVWFSLGLLLELPSVCLVLVVFRVVFVDEIVHFFNELLMSLGVHLAAYLFVARCPLEFGHFLQRNVRPQNGVVFHHFYLFQSFLCGQVHIYFLISSDGVMQEELGDFFLEELNCLDQLRHRGLVGVEHHHWVFFEEQLVGEIERVVELPSLGVDDYFIRRRSLWFLQLQSVLVDGHGHLH